MTIISPRKFLPFLIPLLVLTAAFLLLTRIDRLPPPWHDLVEYLPYMLLVTTLLLGYHFNRGRTVLASLLLLAVYAIYRGFPSSHGQDIPGRLLFPAAALLVPINLTLIAFMRERGVLTMAGRIRLGFLAGQAGVLAWLVHYRYEGVDALLNQRFITIPIIANSTIPHLALLATQIGFASIAVRIILHHSSLESGLLGALTAMAIAFNWPLVPHLFPIFTAAAGFILFLALLQDTHNMAFRDDLTGLPSRRALNEHLMELGRQYVVAMLDVDHFKKFNDTYGHDVGDQVLKMVAQKIGDVGGGGKAFRYGGEEFTVIFQRKRLAETLTHLERVRKSVEEYRLLIRGSDRPKEKGEHQRGKGGGQQVAVTISIGIAESSEGKTTPAEVIKAADKALYKAKSNGRNQISR